MYKMKEVCHLTGLTEKAIRVYMEQKLVEPKVEEGVHRKAYFFEEKDIERLKDIAALRGAGFSIAEIKQMLESPANISLIVEEKESMLATEIQQKLAVQEALKHLTIQEHSDVTKLADAIEPRSSYAKEMPGKRISRKRKWLILMLILLATVGFTYGTAGTAGVWIPVLSFGLVFGIIAVCYAMRYTLQGRRDQKRECSGVGKITAIVENEKIEEYIGKRERGIWKDIMAYLAFGLFGEGIWDMLRPDCWYPVISYQTKDGSVHTATVRYGGFKNDWKIGDTIEIVWLEDNERLVYVCDGQILRKKALVYLVLGVVLLGIFGIGTVQLFGKSEEQISVVVSETDKLAYPYHAERVEIEYGGECWELNEEEENILKRLLEEAEIGAGKYYYSVNYGGMSAVHFYQGDEEIERFTVGDFNYILTKDYMLYYIKPIQIEYNGTNLGESNYITGFLNAFAGKVQERHEKK